MPDEPVLVDTLLSSLTDADTVYAALRKLDNKALLELSSLIEHIIFKRQRRELSSENTVVAGVETAP